MKKRTGYSVLAVVLGATLFTGFAQTPDAKITVMNPIGIKPLIQQIPMAARPSTLDGKTIYIVDSRYPRTREFVEALFDALKDKYPNTKWVLKDKFGGYMDDDPDLWADAKANAHGVIMTVGH